MKLHVEDLTSVCLRYWFFFVILMVTIEKWQEINTSRRANADKSVEYSMVTSAPAPPVER